MNANKSVIVELFEKFPTLEWLPLYYQGNYHKYESAGSETSWAITGDDSDSLPNVCRYHLAKYSDAEYLEYLYDDEDDAPRLRLLPEHPDKLIEEVSELIETEYYNRCKFGRDFFGEPGQTCVVMFRDGTTAEYHIDVE
jgi:hypothetical protein